MTIQPLGTNYHIRLTETPEKTPAGLILPPSLREQWCDGEVIAAGHGLPIMGLNGHRSVMWAEAGNRVLFQKQDLRMIDDRERIGMVRDEKLLGLVYDDGEVSPLNSWCLLSFFERVTERPSGLVLTEKKQRRPNCGRVRRFGSGRMRLSGDMAGTRLPVPRILNLPPGVDLTGLVVHFPRSAHVLDVYQQNGKVASWMIRAEEISCYESDE